MKNELLFELCKLLLPEDPSLEAEVRNCLIEPKTSSTIIMNELGDWFRGVDITRSLPWYQLIYSLYQRDLMFELSARTVAEGMDYYTNQLLRELSGADPSTHSESTSSHNDAVQLIHSFLEITGEHLLAADFRLGEFRLDSGISTITLIPAHTATQCVSLAAESGYGEIILHPLSTENIKKVCLPLLQSFYTPNVETECLLDSIPDHRTISSSRTYSS
ncbi:hypothetical protein SAMN05444392_1093 [Seinonella peptonophila]|uniref:DUF6630 domain-containing protein n=1 Tax=Seinonella peptonophila TaxID=112248 RepID=A0A1M4ZEQ6_9BACL|nr:hypothetical protein [Seinonella peptonophila]SHF16272.1 hypothetical protein SAMN05444392_1093 [Seinonella peptonophila]